MECKVRVPFYAVTFSIKTAPLGQMRPFESFEPSHRYQTGTGYYGQTQVV